MALFQRRHYNAIAAHLREQKDEVFKWNTAHFLAEIFEDDNPNFDRDRFVQACGESE